MKCKKKIGRGILNKLIDLIPYVGEFHPPKYNFCGPGTKLTYRLARGDKGYNALDEACKQHDIAYSQSSDDKVREKADLKLASDAWERVKSSDASLEERGMAYLITNLMNAKAKFFGGGIFLKPYSGRGGKKARATVKRRSRKNGKKPKL